MWRTRIGQSEPELETKGGDATDAVDRVERREHFVLVRSEDVLCRPWRISRTSQLARLLRPATLAARPVACGRTRVLDLARPEELFDLEDQLGSDLGAGS